MHGMMGKVNVLLYKNKNSRYDQILHKLAQAEEDLKKEYGIADFDHTMSEFNHQHMVHTRYLMKCAYCAGMLSRHVKKIRI